MVSALALGRGRWRAHWLAITAGAVAPDLSMVCLYVYERVIWRTRYFDPDWQLVVDLFNSLPLIGVAALIAWRLRSTAWRRVARGVLVASLVFVLFAMTMSAF
jgi:hypothetical protein